jgi:PelA/Pel-15E family pectate lyase
MLEPDGGLHTANLRSARATALYVAKGEGVEEWEPRFTYFGLRYVELSGVERPPEDAIRGVVLQTDLPRTGEFESSSPLLNRLWRNTLWSQRGNFLELPTDCPQRDERAGWSGDAQVFAPTALYNMDAGPFFRQWLFSLRDGLRDDPRGGYPDVAPHTGFGHGSPGWGEAGVIVPWTVWLHTGDRRVLAENLPAIQHALELMAAQSPDGIRLVPASWGDWLAPGFPRYKSPPRQDLIATAYYAHAADLAARIADALDRPQLAASNRALRDQARAAYQRAFIAPDGRVADDVQTSYLLTLAFDLAPPAQRERIVGHLVRTLAEKGDHLATGFLGTPLILPVLTDVGRPDLGYTVLQQTTYPGWLLSVVNGATTIWERWDSWTPERGFHEEGMNSFNHYAYGSVVSWFYDTIAGLRPLPEAPGWKRFRIAPQPGGGLTHAAARIQTPHGEASSTWRLEGGRLRLVVGIPPNTRAEVVLPARDAAAVLLDGAPLARHALAEVHPDGQGRPVVALPSGRYEFLLPAGDEGPPAGPGGSAGGAPGASGPAAFRWGEHVLRQPAGWYASREATALADSVLRYQSPPGGWPKNTDLSAALPSSPADLPAPGDGRANTIDNGATTLPMRFLALVAHATGEARYREAFARGVDYLLAAQYENGGWPQFFPLREGYYSHITYNDGAMVSVLSLLRDAAGGRPPYSFVDAERRARAAAAVARGLACILRTQIRQGGRLTAWCAQHDEKTLGPAWARAYEPPSLSGAESVGIVRFLISLEDPSPEVVAAVEGAVAWLRAVKITGQRLERTRRDDGRTERHLVPDPAAPPLWARFYELGTNRPLYLDRDSVFRYDFAQIGYERRSGYEYHGTWPVSLIEREYPEWRERLRARSANPTAPPAP